MELEPNTPERAAGYCFLMSVEDRERLKAEAAAAGLTLQQLFELRLLGATKPRVRRGRPLKPRQHEELPIAG